MTEHYGNDHEKFDALTVDYIDGALSASDREWFEAHMLECGDCRQRLEDLRFMLSETAGLDEEPPEDFTEFIMNGIELETSRRRSARLTFLRPLISAAACFILVAAGVIAISMHSATKKADLAETHFVSDESFDYRISESEESRDSDSKHYFDEYSDDCLKTAEADISGGTEVYDEDAEAISDEVFCYVARTYVQHFSAIIVVSDPESVEKLDEAQEVEEGVTICELDRDTALEMLSNGEFGTEAYAIAPVDSEGMSNFSDDSDTVVAIAITE